MFKKLITNINQIPNEFERNKQLYELSKFGHTMTLSKKIFFLKYIII